MILKTVLIRFYKSFNFDYLKKYNIEPNQIESVRKKWELIDDMWYPYVEIPIDEKITTIVGANESGKSHLLSAIEKAIYGKDFGGENGEERAIRRDDFCRYSNFFTVNKGELKFPDFGLEWSDLTEVEEESIREICGIHDASFKDFLMFRVNKDDLVVYVKESNDHKKYPVSEDKINQFIEVLPSPFRIDSKIALPSIVPIRRLVKQKNSKGAFESLEREKRKFILNLIDKVADKSSYKSDEDFQESVKDLIDKIFSAFDNQDTNTNNKEYDLAYKLICEVCGIDSEVLLDLLNALREGKDGYVNGIIEMINERLAENLNFPKYWAQDSNFCLRISPRDYDLVFTIRDRTGTEYSFNERSNGLRYFLSYYIQYRIHKPHPNRYEILLMDEPDTYLSSRAQQDLLNIFENFANPQSTTHLKNPIQVVYVTHSPFLISKNHAGRIRVLEKGDRDEGTRVVEDAARNHYEPLRSAFGAFVGETAFIGNCNLVVVGTSQQILIAGAATYLCACEALNSEILDLNYITIVPVDSAYQIPYSVYLARGRDIEQPAMIVLLDNDEYSDAAKGKLLRDNLENKPLLESRYIISISELKHLFTLGEDVELTTVEDLVPIEICLEASKLYAERVCKAEQKSINKLTNALLMKKLKEYKNAFRAIEAVFKEISSDELYIDKVGFARSLIEVVSNEKRGNRGATQSKLSPAIEIFKSNFSKLFEHINEKKDIAMEELTDEHSFHKINRYIRCFLRDNPVAPKREAALLFLKKIENSLEEDIGTKEIRLIIKNLRETYELDKEKNKLVENYEGFKEGLKKIVVTPRLTSQDSSSNLV